MYSSGRTQSDAKGTTGPPAGGTPERSASVPLKQRADSTASGRSQLEMCNAIASGVSVGGDLRGAAMAD